MFDGMFDGASAFDGHGMFPMGSDGLLLRDSTDSSFLRTNFLS